MYNQFKMDCRGMSEIKLVQSMLILIVNTVPFLNCVIDLTKFLQNYSKLTRPNILLYVSLYYVPVQSSIKLKHVLQPAHPSLDLEEPYVTEYWYSQTS